MATRSKSYAGRAASTNSEEPEPRLTRRRIAAVVAGAGGWYTTWLFITAVGIGGIAGFAVSVLVEWLLFEFKREVLSPQSRLTVGGAAAVLLDTILNAGGMWSVVLGLNKTDAYRMISGGLQVATATATATSSTLGSVPVASGELPMLPYLVIALVLGFILALAPHKLWHR